VAWSAWFDSCVAPGWDSPFKKLTNSCTAGVKRRLRLEIIPSGRITTSSENRIALRVSFLASWTILSSGIIGRPDPISTTRLMVSILSISAMYCTLTRCWRKILSRARRVGTSRSKPINFSPSKRLIARRFNWAKGCCRAQTYTRRSLRKEVI